MPQKTGAEVTNLIASYVQVRDSQDFWNIRCRIKGTGRTIDALELADGSQQCSLSTHVRYYTSSE